MSLDQSTQDIVSVLGLKKHPEGGYFREIFRSEEYSEDFSGRYYGRRNRYTSIYFLLTAKDISRFHILRSDELWYYHAGEGVIIHTISKKGDFQQHILGPAIENGESLQLRIDRDTYFGGYVKAEGSYCLMSCMVSPGFEFQDFYIPSREELLSLFPQHVTIIDRLT